MVYADALVTLLLGALLLCTPALSRTTVPLGVSIPRSRIDDPAVAAGIRRFRVGTLAATVVAVVVALAAAALPARAQALAAGVCPLLLLLGALLSMQAGRAGIRRAKIDGDWYAGTTVRVGASVTRDDRPATPWVPYAVATAVLAAAASLLTVWYDRIPARIPQQVDGSGVTRWADKSAGSVFGPLLVGLTVVAVTWGLAWLIRRLPVRHLPDGNPQSARARERAAREVTQRILAATSVAVAVVVSGAATLLALDAPIKTLNAFAAATVVAVVAVVLGSVVLGFRRIRNAAAMPGDGPDSPDDDARWKAGVFYVAPDDPAILVPKRMGIGYTVNLGNPVGLSITAVVLLGAVAAATLPALLA
ncbi:DUF5808 domain-containing protein [Tsukamurella sp. 8F]|uniref:DUF5808 domain-containing protein n=1 Tax=unclassified Tsukamurella TaxID=2633480 RepID=UPI0023BA12CC|nr:MULTISPECIES: DUF5808 domain-containing protein [unclassified Tsukamurella]MDF0528911.1 DUF5808 domain-containing protein [Tsukamurella sp. 8J]MDF0586746.1 DUF5808 domain-containing protein [Tsukamurella sp. 8F]